MLSDKLVQEYKDIFEKEYGKKISDLEAREGAERLAAFANIVFDHAVIEIRRKKRLKEEKIKGFFLEATDGSYTCAICRETLPGNEIWWNSKGLRCKDCWRNIQQKIIPSLDYDGDDKVWIKEWQLQYDYNLHPATRKKLVKEGILKGRDLKRENGSSYCTVYLIKENEEFLKKFKKKSKMNVKYVKLKGDMGNKDLKNIKFGDVIQEYKKSGLNYKLPIILGRNENGKTEVVDLVDLKHIIMTGSTGSGKSVFEETSIATFMELFSKEDLRLVLVDMKRVELTMHKNNPYLLMPVGVDPERVFNALEWINNEKNQRLDEKTRSLENYPYIIVIIDTISDLMAYDHEKFEMLLNNAVHKAEEVKIHFILSDSRASNEVYSPTILNLFPTKICFLTYDADGSKLLLGIPGAEKLGSTGEMLFLPPGENKPKRIQSPYISEEEIMTLLKEKGRD